MPIPKFDDAIRILENEAWEEDRRADIFKKYGTDEEHVKKSKQLRLAIEMLKVAQKEI